MAESEVDFLSSETFVTTNLAYYEAQRDYLRSQLVGKHLDKLPTPAAVVDLAIVKRNCEMMPRLVKSLGLQFRPQIKLYQVRILRRNSSSAWIRALKVQMHH